ncbi:SgcJ/EcaC family oxidoreductase [Burkholderia lata]|uniref:DUF4440 domain-containing protein n=1 Tax=Burkholderia lata (strain ATCC 17760 / DSM 23089 / LMG 22485 / NCIMB 9086 / R18194 / 383) TaxID=482957 RepID=A0A6P2WJX6_BURL3|nr:SgcJ/EcaC family oxidoreductase [Burkholderia lata]VWC93213.1 hypothetical protein BLA18109_04061 [Burkholderia lata]
MNPRAAGIAAALAAGLLAGAVPQGQAQLVAAHASAPPAANAPVALVPRFIEAWNAHDASALGRVFTPDGDFVGIGGRLWHGPDEIARVHAEQFAGRYDASTFVVEGAPTVSTLGPGIALVHWRWTISGVRDGNGVQVAPYSGIFTWVAVEREGGWRVRAAQNNVTR